MIKASSSLLRVILCTLGFSLANSSLTLAQITPDGTVNTQVTQNGNVAEITGGETRDANLFHSFQDFSVPTGNAAFFNNASDIGNIFSRVTGGNISNIDGIISANGSANLFLINPAGIMFGENASLSIGGSFYGSTASSILFEDGAFSAVDLDNPPLLTVNAPVGLSFRDNPGDITANQATLEVPNGETLALLGGNLNFDGGTYGGVGGKLELGGLIESGTIDIDNDGSFDFPQAVTRGNITAASSIFLAAAEEDTSVNVNAKNLSLTSNSFIFNGIVSGLGSADDDAQAGDIVINLTEDLMNDNSSIANISEIGNIGNIIIDARNITFSNGGNIVIFSQSTGDPGNVIINATEDITFDSISDNRFSGITNLFDTGFAGVVGDINLTAQNLNLLNGANITSLVAGNTNSGDINLNIADTIRIEGSGLGIRSDGRQSEFESAIVSNVRDGNGNSGSININAQNLLLREGILSSLNSGQGNAGNININVDSLFITDRGVINGDIRGSGQGGDITINANESVSVIGNSNFFSSIRADIDPGATGEAGNIKITTPSLVIDDGVISADVFGEGNGGLIEINTASLEIVDQSFISADVFGEGNGGSIKIFASDSISLGNASLIQADVLEGATGNAGDLIIETTELTIENSQVSTSTFGNGNAGNLTINASDSISLSGTSESIRGGIFADALIENGDGGDINLTTSQLNISDDATITASNFLGLDGVESGTGEPGNISITADNLSLASEGRIEAITQAETGDGANINLEIADSIFLSGDSFISAQALSNADGGNINIDTNFIVAFPEGNNDIIASAEQGQGGNIEITAESLLGIKAGTLNPFTNDINASSEFGLDGSVTLDIPDIASLEGGNELVTGIVTPEETSTQACHANRVIATQNSLVIEGKGGVPAAPEMPLNSGNIIVNGEIDGKIADSSLPQSIETSMGKILPARGIKVTDQGGIVLTAYRTNNQGDRLPQILTSCG